MNFEKTRCKSTEERQLSVEGGFVNEKTKKFEILERSDFRNLGI